MMRTKEIRMAVVLIAALAVVLLSISGALAGSIESSPSANTGNWTDPELAYVSGDQRASGEEGKVHQYYDFDLFGVVIPTASRIDGIKVFLEAKRDSEGGSIDVELSWNDGASWTSTGYRTGGLSNSDVIYTLGGGSDNWGHDWTASEINDHFRIRVTAHHTGGASPYVYLDWIPVGVYYTPLLPDLIITDKHENWIDNNNFTVSYKVKNQGPCPAGASEATLYVDGSDVEHQNTPALDPGETTVVLTFTTEVNCPSGETVNVTVCADNDEAVDESDETNNCAVNFVDRDLVITDIWIDDSKIYYEIENRGSVKAPRSYSSLYVDGVFKRIDDVNELAPGKSSIESFWGYLWACTSPEDTIEVCADHTKRIAECDESNNCLTETWPC